MRRAKSGLSVNASGDGGSGFGEEEPKQPLKRRSSSNGSSKHIHHHHHHHHHRLHIVQKSSSSGKLEEADKDNDDDDDGDRDKLAALEEALTSVAVDDADDTSLMVAKARLSAAANALAEAAFARAYAALLSVEPLRVAVGAGARTTV